MRNFSTKKHLFKPLNHLLYYYHQKQILQSSRIIQIGVYQPPLHNNQALPLRFLLIINANQTLFRSLQACGIQGHTAKRCTMFWLITNQQSPTPRPQGTQGYHPSTPWQPWAIHAILGNNTTLTWLLDSGASHHVTSNLSNLSLHSPYQGSDDIMIGNGLALPITHTGSTTISTSSRTFTLQNVLCVPSMQKNLISIYQFCTNNHVSVEFSPSAFQVKDLNTRVILLMGEPKDGIYEWPTTFPFVTSSS